MNIKQHAEFLDNLLLTMGNDTTKKVELITIFGQRVKNNTIIECQQVAIDQKEICGLSMSRRSTCDDISHNLEKLKIKGIQS